MKNVKKGTRKLIRLNTKDVWDKKDWLGYEQYTEMKRNKKSEDTGGLRKGKQ